MVSHGFPLAASFYNTVITMEEIGIAEKEGGLPVCDIFILKIFCQLLKLPPSIWVNRCSCTRLRVVKQN